MLWCPVSHYCYCCWTVLCCQSSLCVLRVLIWVGLYVLLCYSILFDCVLRREHKMFSGSRCLLIGCNVALSCVVLCCLVLFSLRLHFYAYALSVRTGSTVLLLHDHGVRLAGARGTCYLALSIYRHVMLRALSCRCRLIVPRRLSVCLGLDFVWCLSIVWAVL